jgi:hypothetical protein
LVTTDIWAIYEPGGRLAIIVAVPALIPISCRVDSSGWSVSGPVAGDVSGGLLKCGRCY